MLGIAYQAGLIPLAAASIEQAIALNGVAVQQNQQAFRYGRRYVCEPQAVLDLAVPPPKDFNEERAAMLLYLEEQYSKAEREAYFYLLKRC
jgi:indolepyruvate ferredoxin oxidoreductase